MTTLVYDGEEFALGDELVLGRHRECGIQIKDAKASRRHTRVFREDGGAWVEDLDSANGTVLNGVKISGRRRLQDGDRIGIGKCQVRFDDPQTKAIRKVTEHDPEQLIGRLVSGYRIHEVIGKGGMGAVYRAKQLSLNRDVAFKVFNSDLISGDNEFAKRFQKEAQLAGTIQHEGIVQVHECGHDEDVLWYSMELVEGDTLEQLLERDQRIAPALALLVCERAALALQAAHDRGIVHYDVKPGNIMLSKQGKIKLLDLGLAEVFHKGRRAKRAQTVVGSPYYISPERAQGKSGDGRSDIYSLGCTLFHLLTGQPPYLGDDATAIVLAHVQEPIPSVRTSRPELPTKLDAVIQGMMDKNPDWRFATMHEVVSEIRPLRDELARQPPPPAKPPAGPRSNRTGEPPLGPRSNRTGDSVIARQEAQQAHKIHGLASSLMIAVFIVVVIAFALPMFRSQPATTPPVPPLAKPADPQGPSLPQTAPPVNPPIAPAPTPPSGKPAATNLGLAERWQHAQADVDRDAAQHYWGSAERTLTAFTAGVGQGDIADAVKLRLGKLQLDGESWYRAQVAALPPTDQPTGLAKALSQLSQLRDVSLAGNRPDAEARYQEALARLLQRLQAARRQARQQIEAGKTANLSQLAAALEPSFRDTPVAALQRQFAAQAGEAANLAKLWKGGWPVTRDALRTTGGADALTAGAALVLAGETADGKKVLMAEPALQSGALLKRREAVLGREAAILTFDDIGDMQLIETLQGDLQFGGGVITAAPGAATGLAISVPVGGDTWEVAMTLFCSDSPDAGPDGGQAVISCHQGDTAHFLLRIEKKDVLIKVHSADGWQEQHPPHPKTAPLKLRIACRAGRLQVVLNDSTEFECPKARIPVGSQLRLEMAGLTWKLDDVQVVGGE